MAVRFGRVLQHGLQTSPLGDVLTAATKVGNSIALGDPDNDSTVAYLITDGFVGYKDGFSLRVERAFTDLAGTWPAAEVAGNDIPTATIKVGLCGKAGWGDGVFPGAVQVGLYVVRVGIDESDLTWEERDDSADLLWAEPGGQLGTDLESTPIATATIDTALFNALGNGVGTSAHAPSAYLLFDITREARRLAGRGAVRIQLELRPMWARALVGTFTFQNPHAAAAAGLPHTYIEIVNAPALAFFKLTSTGDLDVAGFLDYRLVDEDAHVSTGEPSPGSTGPARTFGVGNTTTSDITEVWLVRQGAWPETPSRPPTRRLLRYVHVYDTAGSQGIVDGQIRLVPKPGEETTKYLAYWTPAFGSEGAALSTTVPHAYGTYADDCTFVIGGLQAFMIRSAWWSRSTPGAALAIVGDEVWRIKVLGDSRPPGFTTEAADRHEVTVYKGFLPAGIVNSYDAVTPDRNLPDDRLWTPVGSLTVQQLPRGTSNVTLDLGDGGGSIARSLVPVGSVDYYWQINRLYWIAGRDPSTGALRGEFFRLKGALARDHATTPDCLVTDRPLTYVYGDDAKIGSIRVGQLSARDRGYLATGYDSGSAYVDTVEPLVQSSSATYELVNRATGARERIVGTRAASRINFTGGTTGFRYEAGDLIRRVEQTSWQPLWAHLVAPDGAETEPQESLARAVRKATA